MALGTLPDSDRARVQNLLDAEADLNSVSVFDATQMQGLSEEEVEILTQEVWPEICEVDSDGNDTGSEFREIPGGVGEDMLRVCLQP